MEVEYDFQTAPRYPHSLYEQRISGSVMVLFNGHHDGSITDVKVIDSSHEKFASSVERALRSWQLKPWQVTAGVPAVIPVRQELFFTHPAESRGLFGWIRHSIRLLKCAEVNKALATYRANAPQMPLADMQHFRHTLRLMARYATHQKMSQEKRTEVGNTFIRAIPGIVGVCEAHPDLRYKDVLPAQTRDVLRL